MPEHKAEKCGLPRAYTPLFSPAVPKQGKMSNGPWLLLRGIDPMCWCYEVTNSLQRMGRSEHCDIPLYDPTVSRVHAAICQSGDGAVICDLESANGTFVNGERINKATFQVGDTLLLGSVELMVVSDPNGDPCQEDTALFKSAKASQCLSRAQRRVLDLLLNGLSFKQVAKQLCISPYTVQEHAKRIYRAMGVHSQVELMAVCLGSARTGSNPDMPAIQ